MALIFIASSTPGRDIPSFGVWDTIVKKCGHMIGYALLAAAYYRGLTNGKNVTRFQLILTLGLAVLYSISDEFHQKFTSGRTSSAGDVFIDTVGAVIGLVIWTWIRVRLIALRRSANA
jgi:VanZ family protein